MKEIKSIMRYLKLKVIKVTPSKLVAKSEIVNHGVKIAGVDYYIDVDTYKIEVKIREYKFGILESEDFCVHLGMHINFYIQRVAHAMEMHFGQTYQYSRRIHYGERFIADLSEINQSHYYACRNRPYTMYRDMKDVYYLREIDSMAIESVRRKNVQQFSEAMTIKSFTA